ADWELGHAMAELNSGRFLKDRGGAIPVKTVGATKSPVTTMGGMKAVPDMVVGEITSATTAVLLLPGADTWADPKHGPVIKKAQELLAVGVPVAAICGATGALAQAGMLDNVQHTSNGLQYLQMFFSNYKGAEHYQDVLAVTDGNLITAGSSAQVEFAYHIFKKLEVFEPANLEYWYG